MYDTLNSGSLLPCSVRLEYSNSGTQRHLATQSHGSHHCLTLTPVHGPCYQLPAAGGPGRRQGGLEHGGSCSPRGRPGLEVPAYHGLQAVQE